MIRRASCSYRWRHLSSLRPVKLTSFSLRLAVNMAASLKDAASRDVQDLPDKRPGFSRNLYPEPEPAGDHVLLVLDMQEYFRGMSAEILPKVSNLVTRSRAKHVRVIFTQHGFRNIQNDAGASLRLQAKRSRWTLLEFGSDAWPLMPEVGFNEQEGDLLVLKNRYNAFHETELNSLLRSLGTKTVAVCGVMSNLCCESTCREAFMRDYDVLFIKDAAAARTKEMHDATVLNLSYGFGECITADEFIDQRIK